MVDKEKVIIMTKLAIYDKNDGEEDRKQHEYFCGDYVYKYNFWNRLFVFSASMILLAMYYAHKILIEQINILEMDYKAELITAGKFLLVILVVYSVIGTIRATVKYYSAQKRLKEYFALTKELDDLSQAKDFTEEATARNHGTDIVYTRTNR